MTRSAVSQSGLPSSPPDLPVSMSSVLVIVDRAVAELRRGLPIRLRATDGRSVLALAAEMATDEALGRLADLTGSTLSLVLTGRRATVLGLLGQTSATAVALTSDAPFSAVQAVGLADPLADPAAAASLNLQVMADPAAVWGVDTADGAVALAKLARLLPAMVVAALPDGRVADVLEVSVADVLAYQQTAARTLTQVAEARVPLVDAEDTRIIAFRPADGGTEHLAIVIGGFDAASPVLTRLHSECFTGDLLGSLRCDCGDQLRGAIAEISRAGGGLLLYLAQEGRGIGLVNKLRAYQLQDGGFDTLDANQQLGFDDDERIYLPAVEMLRGLGVERVRLMTNNPTKVEGLSRHGIEVMERVPHVFPSNDHNAGYLRTKANRSGHLF